MYIIDEKDLEYRHGDLGPKYLMKGPRMNYAIVQFPPNTDFQSHLHEIMEENFYILEGKIDIIVDNILYTLTEGQFIHIEPNESHYVRNPYDKVARMVSTLAPYIEKDKIETENPVDIK